VVVVASLLLKLAGIAAAGVIIYGVYWWLKNGRPLLPIAELGQAVSGVVAAARNPTSRSPAEPVAEETSLVNLEAGQQRQQPKTGVLVDVSSPKIPSPPTS